MLRLLKFSILLYCVSTSYTYAQSIFDPAAPAKTNPSTSMSANDFKNTVKSMSQQTSSGLTNEAKQLLPKQPTTGSSIANQAPGTSAQQPAAVTPTSDSFSINAGSPPNPQPGTGSSPAKPSDTYTGFGSGNTGKSSTPASSGNSGGWNINY